MSTTGNYIGFEELISYLNESRNFSYHGFLKHNRNTIIASLTQLTNSSLTTNVSLTSEKWKNFNITWNNRFLDNAKELLDSHTFAELKKKEYEKENTFTTITPLSKKPNKFSETLQSKENNFNTVKSLSKTLQPDISLLSKKTGKSSVKNLSETPQLDLSKNNITFINNFCYDIFHELENESYANLFYKYAKENVKNKVIEYPMDLFTINSKLENNQYTSLKEFEKDI
ncbi:13797_t:CDS:2, partial [Rhizophagus irregularis]